MFTELTAGSIVKSVFTVMIIGFGGLLFNDNRSQDQGISDLQGKFSVTQQQYSEILRRLDRIEDKQDAIQSGQDPRVSRIEERVNRVYRYLSIPTR